MHANLLHFVMSTMLNFDSYLYYADTSDLFSSSKTVNEKTSVTYMGQIGP